MRKNGENQMNPIENLLIDKISYVITKEYSKDAHYYISSKEDYRILYVISGKAELTFADTKRTLCENEWLFMPPQASYYLDAYGSNSWKFYVIAFSSTEEYDIPITHSGVSTPRIKELFRSAHTIWEEKNSGHVTYTKSLIYLILYEIISDQYANTYRTPSLNDVLTYMRIHYKEKLTLETLADRSGYSISYFKRLFTDTMGVSPIRYLNNIRIEHAKEMLRSNLFTIGEIAEECGFENIYYFSNVFKKHTGVSPRNY